MANEKNLENGKATQFRSGEEAARNGQKGGVASGAARRRKKSLKEAADLFMSLPVTDGRTKNKLLRAGVPTDDIDNQMAMIVGLSGKANKGDAKAAKLLIDLLTDNGDAAVDMPDDGLLEVLDERAVEAWQD